MYTCSSCGRTFYTGEPTNVNGKTLCHYCIEGVPPKYNMERNKTMKSNEADGLLCERCHEFKFFEK